MIAEKSFVESVIVFVKVLHNNLSGLMFDHFYSVTLVNVMVLSVIETVVCQLS